MTSRRHRLLMTLGIQAVGGNPAEFTDRDQTPGYLDIDRYIEFAKVAHEGTFDSLWMPDLPMLLDPVTSHVLPSLDPFLLMTALAQAVPDIGVVPTVSASFSLPYTVARQIASLDAISKGRTGVNVVASWHPDVARNYGDDSLPDHPTRYGKTDEFLDVIGALSDSFVVEPSPELAAQGQWYQSDTAKTIDHDGEYFRVRGPLNVPQSRQGRPLLSVAGGSAQVYELAAKHADILYTSALHEAGAQAVRADLDRRAVAAGRPSGSVKVMPGLIPVIGSTTAEAHRLEAEWAQKAGISLDPVERIAQLLEIDPSGLHPDRELTEEQVQLPDSWLRPQAFFHSIVDVARRDRLTVAELARRFRLSVGHLVLVGTPDDVAGTIRQWWENDAVDGFTVLPQNPQSLTDIVNEVIPRLRKDGVFPDRYDNLSLRERFGVQR